MDMKRPLSPNSETLKPRMAKSVSFRADDEEDDAMESDVSFINSQSAINEEGFGMSPFANTPEPPEGIFSPRPPIEQSSGAAAASTTAQSNSSAHSNIFRMDSLDEFYDWTGLGDRYDLKKIVGSGSYGKVAEAYDRGKNFRSGSMNMSGGGFSGQEPIGTRVAIKQCQNIFQVLKESKQMLRELFILRALSGSDQIVSLLDVKASSRSPGQPFRDLYLVFEWADMDLYKLIHSPQFLTGRHVQSFTYQLLKGIKYMQSANVIHRDLKPANILVTTDCRLKICDFGLSRVVSEDKILSKSSRKRSASRDAKSYEASNDGDMSDGGNFNGFALSDTSPGSADESNSGGGGGGGDLSLLPKPHLKRVLTTHVVTRWYRCPELILLEDYTSAVDMWSVGCIVAELLDMLDTLQIPASERRALFPGRSCFPLSNSPKEKSSQKDQEQLAVIFDILGTPSDEDVAAISDPRGRKLLELETKREPVESLSYRYRGAPSAFLHLLNELLTFNPKKRMTVNEALADPLFADIRNPQEEKVAPCKLTGDFDSQSTSQSQLNPNAKPFSLGETLSNAASALMTPWAPAAVQQIAPQTSKNSPAKLTEESLRLLIQKEVAAYV